MYPTATDLSSGIAGLSNPAAVEGRISVVSNLARSPPYSIRHELHKSDPDQDGSKRCESDSMAMTGTRIASGATKYYGFSVYFPSTWQFNAGATIDIIFQWKGFSGGPFMMLVQKYQGLYLRLGKDKQFALTENIQRGKWHDVRAMVHWDVGANGQVQMDFKTADKSEYARVIDYKGATMDRDAGGYLKWGIYRPDWKTDPSSTTFDYRSIWHDNIAVGDSWAAVDPSLPASAAESTIV